MRRLAKTCEFTASTDPALTPLLQSLRDQFVFALNNEAWQRRLLHEADVLTFTRAVEITNAAEAAQKDAHQFNTFSARGSSDVHAVKPRNKETKARKEEVSKGKQNFSSAAKSVNDIIVVKRDIIQEMARPPEKPLVPLTRIQHKTKSSTFLKKY